MLRDRDADSNGSLEERLYSISDAMGSITSILNTSGNVQERYGYTAFGVREVMAADFSERTSSIFGWEPAFHGELLDLETNYSNYGFRCYHPETGRWLSRDPIGERGGINLYAMVRNSPVNFSDRLGLEIVEEHMTNCLGYATEAGGAAYPENRESLREALKELGYEDCTEGVSAAECREKCGEDSSCYIMVYVYIPKTCPHKKEDFNPENDYFDDPWGKYRGTLDYHAIRGKGGGGDGGSSYDYQPHRDKKENENIQDYTPDEKRPDYFGDHQLLGKACCCK